MSKFNAKSATPRTRRPSSYITSEPVASTVTGNGAPGFLRTPKSELFLLAVSNFVGEDTFYEKGVDRDTRFRDLARAVAVEDPRWMLRFVSWLRGKGNMRSAPLVAALEAAHAILAARLPHARKIVGAALQRADEPGEALAYWLSRYGRNVPQPVKRGIADAVTRLYDEYSLLKYDGATKGVRFGDVLDLCHPKVNATVADRLMWPDGPNDPDRLTQINSWLQRQAALYEWALGRRHNREQVPNPELLPMVTADRQLRREVAAGQLDGLYSVERLRAAGMTWEDVLSLGGSRLDKKRAWEALIPTMGIFALLRNLRNFDEAGVSLPAALTHVVTTLTDPRKVARSQLFPYRFLAAYRSVSSVRWAPALETALNLSLHNVPELPGRTLVLVDRSGSMFDRWSDSSDMSRADQAAIFGSAIALRNQGQVTLVQYGTSSQLVTLEPGHSLLKAVNEKFSSLGGTETRGAIQTWFKGHDRIIVITDEQANFHSATHVFSGIPTTVPCYTWNLAGYRAGHAPNVGLRYTFGGLSDAAFAVIPLLEQGTKQNWPF